MNRPTASENLLAATRFDFAATITAARQAVAAARQRVTLEGPTAGAWDLAALAAELESAVFALEAAEQLRPSPEPALRDDGELESPRA